MRFRVLPVLAILAVAGCESDPAGANGNSGTLQFVSGVHGNVDVIVDGTVKLTDVPLGASMPIIVGIGPHNVTVRKVGGATGVTRIATVLEGDRAIIVATDSAGAPRPSVLLDTSAVVPAGATKLRVVHLAAAAPAITAWRTQPDFATETRVQFPFPYDAVSPYLQSTVGDWRVMISSEDNTAGTVPMPDTLANSGLIAIPSGESRTVVVVDGATAGSVQLVVVNP
jgi:hypothetical protein